MTGTITLPIRRHSSNSRERRTGCDEILPKIDTDDQGIVHVFPSSVRDDERRRDGDGQIVETIRRRRRAGSRDGGLYCIQKLLADHIRKLHLSPTQDRLRKGQLLYTQFLAKRFAPRLALADLQAQDFRCFHCGLAFCNEELLDFGWVSPHRTRGTDKSDPPKPQWNKPELRVPRIEHEWPIKLYGDNDRMNIRVFCHGCNDGKAGCMALMQTRSYVGLPTRGQMLCSLPITPEAFYSQLVKQPCCCRTGRTAKESELTVELLDPESLPVLDNLATVESP